MTGNLFTKIQIPVKPQIQTQNSAPNAAASHTYNPLQTFSKFEYPPAVPLSAPHTKPKGTIEDPAKGKIVKETFLQSMKSTVKSYGDYCKYFYNAGFKGKGTDYSVGKINDLAIRVGSLGIAITLASSKFFPFARGMEFVGLGTWFAAMAAWPKLLALPVKARTGLDPSLKYEDSQGRRKSFFEDRQYLCFDLFKHIDKNGNYNPKAPEYEMFDNIGDKLGIPRNIPNRREAIQNKIAQYAVQYNTLTMLTAGVMTPVLSSLVADQLQIPLGSAIEKTRILKTGMSLQNMSKNIDSLLTQDNLKIDNAIETLGTKLDSKLAHRISSYIPVAEDGSVDLSAKYISPKEEQILSNLFGQRYYGTGFGTGILQELETESVISKNAIPVNDVLGLDIKNLSSRISEKLKEIKTEEIRTLFNEVENSYLRLSPDNKNNLESSKISDILTALKNSKKGKTAKFRSLIAAASTYENMTLEELKNAINNKDLDKLKLAKYNIDTTLQTEEIWRGLDSVKRIMKNSDNVFTPIGQKYAAVQLQVIFADKFKSAGVDSDVVSALNKVFEGELTRYFDIRKSTLIRPEQLQKLFKLGELNLQIKKTIDSYKAATIKDIAESVTARSWDKLPKKYFNLIGFSKEELEQLARIDSVKASEIISHKFSELAKDENKLNHVITMMSKYAKDAVTKEQKAFIELVGTIENPGLIIKAEKLTQKLLDNSSFTGELRSGFDKFYIGSKKAVKQKVVNTIDSLGKPIQILDIFKSLDVEVVPKIENNVVVGDKLANPEKAPHIIKDFLGVDSHEFFKKMQADMEIGKYYTFQEGYDEPGAYKKAVNSLVEYIKDIALQKNDISDWITKFEVQPEGFNKGIKHSKHMVGTMADTIFSHFSPATRAAIENGAKGLSDIFENNKTEMKRRFLGADSVIVSHSNFENYGTNFVHSPEFCALVDKFFNSSNASDAQETGKQLMQLIELRRIKGLNDTEINDAIKSVKGYIDHLVNGSKFDKSASCIEGVKDIYNHNNSINMTKLIDNLFNSRDIQYVETAKKRLTMLLEDRAIELGANKDFQDVLNTINGYISHLKNGSAFNKEGCKNPFYKILNAKTANKDIGEMAGKNTVDFMLRAAQNIRSRNKWQVLVWSLFAGTVGFSLITLANMGHTNSFNPDHWKHIKKNGDNK